MSDEKERKRLVAQYANMPLEQLRQLAAEPASLTDIARELLQAEMNRRDDTQSLEVISGEIVTGDTQSTEPSAEETVAEDDESLISHPVMIRRFRDLPEALLAKGRLETAGVECSLADDNMVRMDWFISNLLGGVKLLVNQEDAEEANTILDQPIPENFDVEGVGEYHQPHCPQCGSLDVSFEELNKPLAYGSAYLTVPLPLHNRGWACHACKHKWDGSSDEPAST